MVRRRSGKQRDGGVTRPNGVVTTGHEAELWAMAAALRGSMDAAEYKHVVLGPIFLKYISDAFEERHATVLAEFGEDAAEDHDEYTAENIFWVPPEARWSHLRAQARQSTIGLTVDQAMAEIERDNPALKDVLPRLHHPERRYRQARGLPAESGPGRSRVISAGRRIWAGSSVPWVHRPGWTGIRGSVSAETEARLLICLRGDSHRNLETASRRREPCA